MKRILPLLVALPLALASAALAAPEVAIERCESTVAGQGVDGVPGVTATFIVKAPPEEVLQTLWDVRRFPEIFPDIKKMDVLHREAQRLDVAFEVDAVVAKVRYTLRRHLDQKRRTIRWREIDGDLERVRGAWKVEGAMGGHTRLTYESFVKPGGIVPTGLYRDLVMGKLKEMAGRVKAACEQP